MGTGALLSAAAGLAIFGACIHLVARIWSPRRLFFVHLGRELTPRDRARSRRLVWGNALLCAAGILVMAVTRGGPAAFLAGVALPLGITAWLVVEMVVLLRTVPPPEAASSFRVPPDGPPSVLTYVSIPHQVAGLAILVASVTAFLWVRDRLPPRLPMHWNLRGHVDRTGSPAELWVFPAFMLFNRILVWFVAWSASRERRALPPENSERYVELQRRRRALMVRFAEWTAAGLDLFLAVIWLGLAFGFTHGPTRGFSRMLLLACVVLAAAVLGPLAVFIRPLVRVQDEIRALAGSDVLGTRPDGWRWGGMVYYAPDDPAVIVPKRVGIGQTLNFARPLAWVLLGALILLPLALGLGAVLVGR